VQPGDVVRVPPVRQAVREQAPVPAREFPVLLEDEHLLAIDKPAGVAVHGGSGVSFGVIEQLRRAARRPSGAGAPAGPRDLGLLLMAKKRSALTHLQDQFRERRPARPTWPGARRLAGG
jgi:23S rRNA pseudouridine955/2504/2580 synthase